FDSGRHDIRRTGSSGYGIGNQQCNSPSSRCAGCSGFGRRNGRGLCSRPKRFVSQHALRTQYCPWSRSKRRQTGRPRSSWKSKCGDEATDSNCNCPCLHFRFSHGHADLCRPCNHERCGCVPYDSLQRRSDAKLDRCCFKMPQRITRQPHTFANGQVLTWDGHLDNRDDLARELHVELTARTTDLAIVAAGYERFGCDSFKRLVGDWALVVWDPHSREMGSGGMRPGSAVFNLRITRMSCRPRGTAQRRTSKEDCKLDAEKAAKQLSRRVQDLYEFRRAGYEWNEI